MTATTYSGHCPNCRLRQPVRLDGQVVAHRRQTGYDCLGGSAVWNTVRCCICRRDIGQVPHARGCRNEPLQVAG